MEAVIGEAAEGTVPPSELPYDSIASAPDGFTAGSVLGRYMDGLGFRYRWATEGLSDEELNYRISASSWTLRETLVHILDMVRMVECAFTGELYGGPATQGTVELSELRSSTLELIEGLSRQLMESDASDFEGRPIRLQRRGREISFPFWNVINGPMSDALHHVGQVFSYRRAAGNPIDPGVKVFLGINTSGQPE